MKEGFLPGLEGMPLLVEPDGPHDPVRDPQTLTEWAIDNREWIEERLKQYGVILFRGYGFHEPEFFEAFVSKISPQALDYARGASPRKKVRGKVYTSTETPRWMPIPLHCDMSSYGRTAPAKIFFNCLIPARVGGHTPIADMKRYYDELDPDIRRRFEEGGLRMIQNVPERRTLRNVAPKTWPEMFETDDRATVEEFCRKQGIEFTWKPDGSIRLVNYTPAAVDHPQTGDRVWYNSAHNFYPTWAWEVKRLGNRILAGLIDRHERKQRENRPPEDRANYCTFADGTEIPPSDIEAIRQMYWDQARLFDWEAGDLVVMDNIRIAHGRMPFRGARRVLVMMTEPWEKPTLSTSRSDPGTVRASQ